MPPPELNLWAGRRDASGSGLSVPDLPGAGLFMMPRRDGIVLGGTRERGVWSLLLLLFIWRDAHKNARAFWPYATLTIAAGAFGPLLYLLLRPGQKAKDSPKFATKAA